MCNQSRDSHNPFWSLYPFQTFLTRGGVDFSLKAVGAIKRVSSPKEDRTLGDWAGIARIILLGDGYERAIPQTHGWVWDEVGSPPPNFDSNSAIQLKLDLKIGK